MTTKMLSLARTRRRSWLLAFALLGVLVLGMAIQRYAPGLGHAGASDARGDTPVRVVAVKLEQGGVEVGVQAQQTDGSWGEVIRPAARFLPAGAPVGRRLHSSPVRVQGFYPLPESIEALRRGTEGFYSESPLYCVINHGAEGDAFSQGANYRTSESGRFERNNIRIVSTPDGAAQAAAIRQCVADGAAENWPANGSTSMERAGRSAACCMSGTTSA